MFKALVLNQNEDRSIKAEIKSLNESQLPIESDVLVDIDYSSINYKDALAITGKLPIVRKWPMIPGIDGVGKVVSSNHSEWKIGDNFILNGWGVGENHLGCFSEKAKLKGDWLVPLPVGMTPKTAMSIGTAGYTAMLCVMALENNEIKPKDGEILVTGASGGVGSFVISILSQKGYKVVASTGKIDQSDYLKFLGASEIINRNELSSPNKKPIQKERWAGVIDSIGSHTLVNAIAQSRYNSPVISCGLAQGTDLNGSVFPFILRAIKLIGVDSVYAKKKLRINAWSKLNEQLNNAHIERIAKEITLDETINMAKKVINGEIFGRLVVKISS
tara:strand:+ start:842 stop:1834 length:993 start_codon:yes stop_codon:yes gene_type:complete